MRYNHIKRRLKFFENIYRHLEKLPYTPGILMLYKAFPVKLQAELIEIADNEKLPNPGIFSNFGPY